MERSHHCESLVAWVTFAQAHLSGGTPLGLIDCTLLNHILFRSTQAIPMHPVLGRHHLH